MLFSQKLALVGQQYFDIAAALQQYALAAQAAVDAWIYSPVYKIFLFVAELFQVFLARLHVHMAGAAGAHAAAVMVKVDVVLKGGF